MQKLVKLIRFNTKKSFFFCDEFFRNHVDSHFYGCSTGTFSVAALKHEKFSFFNRKFHILHIAIMFFKFCSDVAKLLINIRIFFFKLGKFFRGADTCNNVFALCIHKIFTHEFVYTVRRIAAETYAGSGCITLVSEYHCHYGNGCSFKTLNLIQFAVFDCTAVHPRTENRINRTPHLLFSILWEFTAGVLFIDFLVLCNKIFKVVGSHVGIFRDALSSFYFVDCVFKFISRYTHRNIAEHLNKTAV